MDKAAAIVTRRRIAEEAQRERWIVAAGHFTEPNVFGRIARSDDGYVLAPFTP
jgi:hypothetical protein